MNVAATAAAFDPSESAIMKLSYTLHYMTAWQKDPALHIGHPADAIYLCLIEVGVAGTGEPYCLYGGISGVRASDQLTFTLKIIYTLLLELNTDPACSAREVMPL